MSAIRSSRQSTIGQTLKKLCLSSVVIFTFVIYAVRERLAGSPDPVDANLSLTPAQVSRSSEPLRVIPTAIPLTNTPPNRSDSVLSTLPTSTPIPVLPTQTPDSLYKDGDFVGAIADAFYGTVQVKAIIQGGKITDVQFLDYPHDRRISAYINSQVMPYLTMEAVQAQSAQVDIISGATLTSEAFIESLQSALNGARS